MDKDALQKRISEIETEMSSVNFWNDKDKAQATIREFQELKDQLEGVGKYDKGDAVMTIFSGAGGDDSEDFSRMLLNMYLKYLANNGFGYRFLHENKNDHDGYRNVSIEIEGKNAYGTLKNESGVHRLVRISPFNAKGARHTSFSMVEVIPKFSKADDLKIPEDELKIEYTRSSGPGGQNVNKRETAVRIVHLPTNLSAESQSERSQEQNKEKAMSLLSAKIYKKLEEARKKEEAGMYVSKTTEIEWGNQIRSYVLHPYKMIKDHRTDVETHDISHVLEDGGLEAFIEAEKEL
jgi:peptide chain release factor 2